MTNTYGVLSSSGIHTDVSKTLRGAKNYATRNGYNAVSIRYGDSFNVEHISTKFAGDKHWTDA